MHPALGLLFAPLPTVSINADHVVVSNGRVSLTIDRGAGRYGVSWGHAASLTKVGAEGRLSSGRTLSTVMYTIHGVQTRRVHDALGRGVEVAVHNRAPNEPELRQTFWVYEGRPEVVVRLDIVGEHRISSPYLAPIVSAGPLRFPHRAPLQCLFVPFDNDSYVRFRSNAWNESSGSCEVSATYDDSSRRGIVVGSLDHSVWKSAIRFTRSGALTAFAGATSKYTHDTQPHGDVAGPIIRSPRFVIGYYHDWRAGMERFGDLNALVAPPLHWAGGVPFGWNSWSGHKTKVNAEDARVATDFVSNQMSWLRSGGTAYINLDSFWDNLTEDDRAVFVRHAHAAGLKAGIYYTPFTAWGKLTDHVDDTSFTYGDVVLKDAKGNPLSKLDGGHPIDPTHPAALARIDRELAYFTRLGFDFVKLDFLTHGALEGKHFDPAVPTGLAAYSIGMHRILDDLSMKKTGRPIFIALSIAPLFPNGFGHSRRISCDIFANIGATEYLLNSTTYGWWEGGRLYQFNDGDSSCVYQPLGEPPVTEAESRSRLTASVITGGIVIDGDDLTNLQACSRVLKIFANPEVLALARKAVSFRPVCGDTGDRAGDAFEWRENMGSVYVALFNFDKAKPKDCSISIKCLGIGPSVRWQAHDLWTGETRPVTGDLTAKLSPMGCQLLLLSRRP